MSRRKAETLFRLLADDLLRVRPELGGDVVICPMCYREFGPDAIQSGELTVEHIIPGALGGSWVTLTCKPCNNKWGTAFDSHFVQSIRVADSLKFGTSPIRARVSVGGVTVNADVAFRSGEKHDPIVIRVRGSNPDAVRASTQHFESRTVEQVDLHLNMGFIADRANRALIRIALLGLFDHIGYAYVLAKGVQAYWSSIASGSPSPDEVPMFISTRPPLRGKLASPFVVVPIEIGETAAAYLTVLQIDTHEKRHFSVLMPTEASRANTVIADLRLISRTMAGKTITFSVTS